MLITLTWLSIAMLWKPYAILPGGHPLEGALNSCNKNPSSPIFVRSPAVWFPSYIPHFYFSFLFLVPRFLSHHPVLDLARFREVLRNGRRYALSGSLNRYLTSPRPGLKTKNLTFIPQKQTLPRSCLSSSGKLRLPENRTLIGITFNTEPTAVFRLDLDKINLDIVLRNGKIGGS